MRHKGACLTVVAVVVLILPTIARADFQYSITTSAGIFSFAEPALLTSPQFFSTGFSLNVFTFTQGVFCSGGIFAFATSGGSVSDCSVSTNGVPGKGFLFLVFGGNPTSTGTFSLLIGSTNFPITKSGSLPPLSRTVQPFPAWQRTGWSSRHAPTQDAKLTVADPANRSRLSRRFFYCSGDFVTRSKNIKIECN